MSVTCGQIADNNLRAARVLLREGLFRSSINRSYFAVYARLTHELKNIKADFQENREAPGHHQLQKMISSHLSMLTVHRRRDLKRLVLNLYNGRIEADYHRSKTMGRSEALRYQNYAVMAMRHLEQA